MDPSLLGRPAPAPTAQKQTGLMTKKTLIIALVIVVALIGGALLFVGGSDNTDKLLQTLSARQSTTQRIVADGQKNIANNDLAKLNSELNIILTGDTTDLQRAISEAGIKKLDKEVAAAEADAATFEKLATAKLNGQYDTVYRGVLSRKLESLLALLNELYEKSQSKSLKAVLSAEYEHISTYSKTLETLPN